MYYCVGKNIENVRTKLDCLKDENNQWVNSQYNFDNLKSALIALFVSANRDGWVNIMYTGIDAVGVDKQPIKNYNEWIIIYFVSFIVIVGFFVLNMSVGILVESFHKCYKEHEKREEARREMVRAEKMEEKRKCLF